MAGIAGVQGGNINALETMLASLRHRGSHEAWTSPTEHTKIGCCKLGTESRQQRQLNSQANGKFAILDGHLNNATSRGLTDAALALSLYEKFGAQWLDRLMASHSLDFRAVFFRPKSRRFLQEASYELESSGTRAKREVDFKGSLC